MGERATTYWSGSRRDALALVASAATTTFAGCSFGESTVAHGWNRVNSPTEKALHDVVFTTSGPCAVGESGHVLTRGDSEWETVVKDGPGGAGNGLFGASVTADRKRVWFAGDSGAVGYYDPASDESTDRSAPKGKTSSWADVAAVGPAGDERVWLINSSGELLTGTVSDDTVEWSDVMKPTNGTTINAIAATDSTGYVCDGSGNVARRGSNGWRDIGIDGESASLHDVVAPGAKTTTVVGDDGSILRYDGFAWMSLAEAESALHAVDRRGGRGLAAGPDGTVFAIEDSKWQRAETKLSMTLHGVALGTVEYADVAVGSSGTILENFQ